MLNLFDHISSRETFFFLLLVTRLQNEIKIIKSAQNNKQCRNRKLKFEVAREKSGLLAEINVLLLLDGHNFLQD